MGWLSILRWFGVAVAGLAIAAVIFLAVDRFDQKARADKAERCEKAAISASDTLADCGPNLFHRVSADRRAIICESALLPDLRPETRFTALQACMPGVQRLIAEGDSKVSEIAALNSQLAKLRADGADAVARAEARGRADHSRRTNAEQLIKAAPRGADGRIACDADCLRKLAN